MNKGNHDTGTDQAHRESRRGSEPSKRLDLNTLWRQIVRTQKMLKEICMKYCWIALALLLGACARTPSPEQLAEQQLWEQQLISHIQLFKFYPANAQAQGLEGQVNIEFIIDAHGNLLRQRVISHSGSELFVAAVQASLPAASPMPAPPASVLKDGEVEVRAPFVFCVTPSCAG
ncbi:MULTISPECIES: TonB family protein [Pseudomonas]|uniref:energy transducer TonB n=1 Tax=Pseudomonas TaxID=286 RepID=UPI0020040931|nr:MULTISPECIES: TonB family protein [Pseudomonas]